eukprot:snap_masked-scaffold_12-processed-gene-9.24-mRNA-1 protein AED:1.00 eAED:1.00 QI:0/-1/0/0/-1/1/1/0/397
MKLNKSRGTCGLLVVVCVLWFATTFMVASFLTNSQQTYTNSQADSYKQVGTLHAQNKKVDRNSVNKPCGFVVLMRTQDGTAFISEVLSYYLVHGATKIYLVDYSNTTNVRREISWFVDNNYVEYFHSENFEFKEQTAQLHKYGLDIIKTYIDDPNPWWLLSVDDDEFVLPASRKLAENDRMFTRPIVEESNRKREVILQKNLEETIKDFLCQESLLKYKTARFIWRGVGTNGVERVIDKNGKLDIDVYTNMQYVRNARGERGKSAFHINHPEMSTEKWDHQGYEGSAGSIEKRKGGSFFMHGNIEEKYFKTVDDALFLSDKGEHQFLGDYSMFITGYTYHFSRSKEQLFDRANRWKNPRIRKNKINDAKKKDVNEVYDAVLAHWVPAVESFLSTKNY